MSPTMGFVPPPVRVSACNKPMDNAKSEERHCVRLYYHYGAGSSQKKASKVNNPACCLTRSRQLGPATRRFVCNQSAKPVDSGASCNQGPMVPQNGPDPLYQSRLAPGKSMQPLLHTPIDRSVFEPLAKLSPPPPLLKRLHHYVSVGDADACALPTISRAGAEIYFEVRQVCIPHGYLGSLHAERYVS